jgi:hypothetical protein
VSMTLSMIRGVTIFNSLLPVGSVNLEAVLRARDDRAIPTFVLCTFIGPLMLGTLRIILRSFLYLLVSAVTHGHIRGSALSGVFAGHD